MPLIHLITSPKAHYILTFAQYFTKAAFLVKLCPFKFFLFLYGIIHEKLHALKFDHSLCNLEHHALEGTHWLFKLLMLICIQNCLVECSLGKANHLGCDTNATYYIIISEA